MKIGWIGTGDMGAAMAGRLIDAGFEVYLYNRTREKAEALDAPILDSPAEITRDCDVIFTSLTNIAALDKIAGEIISNSHTGQILVDTSTLSPADSETLNTKLTTAGIFYLSCPVLGSMFMIKTGELKLLVSGDKDSYENIISLLNAIGTPTYLGNASESRILKLACNMIICSYLTIHGIALFYAIKSGFNWDETLDYLEHCPAASPMLFDKGTTLRQRVWEGKSALVTTAAKDLHLAIECAKSYGFKMPTTEEIWKIDDFMVSSPKYKTYSTFGTIHVLESENLIPFRNMSLEDSARFLSKKTIAITNEAISLCGCASLDKEIAISFLKNCHGATLEFKNF